MRSNTKLKKKFNVENPNKKTVRGNEQNNSIKRVQ